MQFSNFIVTVPAMDAVFLTNGGGNAIQKIPQSSAKANKRRYISGLNVDDYHRLLNQTEVTPIPVLLPKYDRTAVNLRKKFDCLRQALSEKALKTYPTKKEIADLIVGLKDNRFYRTKRHLVKLGLAKEIVEEHKVNLLRLVNFEGTNEAYCEKPIR